MAWEDKTIFANFTEETCTGTGATLALAGATTGNIPFSASFADGDLVAYVVEDSGGSIKVAGIGTYVSATDDITRNDTWNYNGTVVDNNPSTNVTLSGGTHTVRCDVVGNSLSTRHREGFDISAYALTLDGYMPSNITSGVAGKGRGSNDAPFNLVYQPYQQTITKLGIRITTADAASANNLSAVYSANENLMPDRLLASTGHLSGASTGAILETLSTPLYMPAGYYYYTTKSDSTTLRTTGANNGGFYSIGGFRRSEKVAIPRITIVGAYPADAPTSSGGWAGENNGFSSPIYDTY